MAAFAAAVAVGGGLTAAQAAEAGSIVYSTAGEYRWTAPAGVSRVHVIAVGGAGGKGAQAAGGAGAQVVGDLDVNPGQPFLVDVGAPGQDAGRGQLPAGSPATATSGGPGGTGPTRLGGAGGWGWLTGTYAANAGGGGGGSASAFVAGVVGQPVTELVVAGGGGGAATVNAGGDGGRPSGFRGAGTLAGGGGANSTHGAPGGATGAAGSDGAGPGGAGGSPLPGDHGGGGGGGGGGYGSGGGGAVSNAATLGSGGGGGGSRGPVGATFSRAVTSTGTPTAPFVWLTWTDPPAPRDTTAPTSTTTAPSASKSKTIVVSYHLADAGFSSGLARVSLWVKGPKDTAFTQSGAAISPIVEAGGSFSYTAAEGDGTYQFATRAVDNAGNDEGLPTKAKATTMLDTVAPAVTWAGNAGTYDVDAPIWIVGNVSDPSPSSGVVSSVYGSHGPSSTAYRDGLGTHTLTGGATDAAGNTSSAQTSYTVIATPGGVGRLLAKLVKASSAYQGQSASGKAYVDAIDASLAGALTASPRRVADFQHGVDSLAGGGYLTAAQATDLKNLAAGL